ncbi:hypothetical protein N836_30775 [Leptolyngbya sp. Heron Island J]|nr:hypothetical protein N836_30775 [Leptolyngbya sp. Heron Island J]
MMLQNQSFSLWKVNFSLDTEQRSLALFKSKENIMAKDITVLPGEIYIVTDQDRDFGTVTIQLGGQLKISTAAQVTIQKLIKET